MNDNFLKNNKVYLYGEVASQPTYSHELYGEAFYEFMLSVKRLSGQEDLLPVTVSERLISGVDLSVGASVALRGQFRSYNKLENDKSKLMLTIFVRDFCEAQENEQGPNIAELNGYLCKPPVYRTTPFNREICDMLLAVNRGYNKSDYIPCIAWGRNARFARDLEVGKNVLIVGRIQSRQYNKRLEDDTVETRTAYELSVNKLMLEPKITLLDEPSDETAVTTIDEN